MKRPILALPACGYAILAMLGDGPCHAAETDSALSKEAEAARMGAPFEWNVDRIRDELERQAGAISYGSDSDGPVTPLPSQGELAAKGTAELFDLCAIWNPAIRYAAADEIARRGGSAFEFVMENVTNPRADRRVAAGQALVGMLKHAGSGAADSPERQLVISRFPDILSAVARLFQDENTSVRQAVLPAYDRVGRLLRGLPAEAKDSLPAFAQAGLKQASVEPDGHICQNFLNTFSRSNAWLPVLDRTTRATLLGKALLQQPFPRGRGSAMRMISRLERDEIRSILPQILEDFKTPCLRDSMFFPGGRTVGFRLIVEHGDAAPEILNEAIEAASALNREPWVSFSGRHRKGMRVFWDALGELGPTAKSVLPSLQELQRDAEARLAEHTDKESARYRQAKEIADYGNSIIEKIGR